MGRGECGKAAGNAAERTEQHPRERRGTGDEKGNLARWPQPPRYLGVFLAHTSLASRSRLSSK